MSISNSEQLGHPCKHLYGWSGEDSFRFESKPGLLAPISDLPTFSVVIPTRNQATTIGDTLLSLIHQEYPHLQIIVMDGASDDSTLSVLQEFRSHIDVLESEHDNGQSDAINKGFRQANGDILFWLNSDDYLLPGALWNVAQQFQSDPSLDFLVGSGDVISIDHHFLRYIPAKPMDENTIRNWRNDEWVLQQACFWTRRLWEKHGGVDEQLHLLMDYDLWCRFSRVTQAAMLDQKLSVMRYYPEAKTVRGRDTNSEEMAYVYAKNGHLDLLRIHIADRIKERHKTEHYLQQINSCIPVRLLKRIALFPLPNA